MVLPKRAGASLRVPGRQKKRRVADPVANVLAAIADADALSSGLRALLKASLPVVLTTNKASRQSYESEVVDKAERALANIQVRLEESHSHAKIRREELTKPEERARRIEAKREVDASFALLKSTYEDKRTRKAAAEQSFNDAKSALATAQRDAAVMYDEMQLCTDSKATLSSLFDNELGALRQATSASAKGRNAAKALAAVSKEYCFDETLMRTFLVTCKKAPASRTEFDEITFNRFQNHIEQQIDTLTERFDEMVSVKAEKLAAAAAAREGRQKAETTLAKATEELTTAQTAYREAKKHVAQFTAFQKAIWADIKEACDEADHLAQEMKEFKDGVVAKFQELKEKAPEPEAAADAEPPRELSGLVLD